MRTLVAHHWLVLPLAIALLGVPCLGQTPPTGQSVPAGSMDNAGTTNRLTRKDSIVVGAHLTPEEIEDGKINDVYQPLYHLTKPNECPQIVKLSEEQIMPMAEKSKFEETRNKYLFLANREIAGCEMASGLYEDAERRYQKLFEYLEIWPRKDDSDYPLNYRSIGSAEIMQQKWKEAAQSLEKSIAIYDLQIDSAVHSDSKFMREEHVRNLRMSEAQARNLLAVAYFRDERQPEAMGMLEKAYEEAIQSSATPQMIQQIIDSGRAASAALGDTPEKAKWDARSPTSK